MTVKAHVFLRERFDEFDARPPAVETKDAGHGTVNALQGQSFAKVGRIGARDCNDRRTQTIHGHAISKIGSAESERVGSLNLVIGRIAFRPTPQFNTELIASIWRGYS